MSTSTSKLIFLLFLPVLTAEKCAGSKNGKLKRNASTVAPSKTAAVADTMPLTDLATTEAQPNCQQEEQEDKNNQIREEVKSAIADVQEAKNTKTTQKDQSGEGGHVFKTKEDKQSINSDDKENFSESANNNECSQKQKKVKCKKPMKHLLRCTCNNK